MILDDAEINSTYNGKNKNKKHLSSGDKTPTKYREARGTRNWLHLSSFRVVGQKGSIYPSKHYSLLPRLLVTFYNTGSQPVGRDAMGEEIE